MKSILTRIALLSFLLVILIPNSLSAEIKTFIKEYTYNASEVDNELSRRATAMREVKRLLLEELGTYLECITEVRNFQLTKDQLTALTEGIAKTEIIDEKWYVDEYWIKSKIIADTGYIIKSIGELSKDGNKLQELEDAKNEVEFILKENKELRQELAYAKDNAKQEVQRRYDNSIKELISIEWLDSSNVNYNKGDYAIAIVDLDKAIELTPDYAMAYSNRSVAYSGLGKYDKAIADLNKAIELNPYYAIAYFNRGIIYGRLGKYDEAIADLNKAIDLNTNNAMAYYFNRGIIYGRLGKYDEAIADFNKAIKLNTNYADAYINRGATYCGLGKYNEAIADFNKAIELNPNGASAYNNRGTAYNILGKYDEAIVDLNKAIDLNPYYADAYYVLACSHSMVGNEKSNTQNVKKGN
jgi:tetratricopeptide (TPR) repeat protein